jgi:DegT/DnrJ/EryC1/StrS aminotransferase family
MVLTTSRMGLAQLERIPAQGNGPRFFRWKEALLQAQDEMMLPDSPGAEMFRVRIWLHCKHALKGKGVLEPPSPSIPTVLPSGWLLRLFASKSEAKCPATTLVDIATIFVVHDTGRIPVFVAVGPCTLTGSPVTVNEKIAAIIPLHQHGQMADMSTFLDLAVVRELNALEDASHVHGTWSPLPLTLISSMTTGTQAAGVTWVVSSSMGAATSRAWMSPIS